MTSRICSYLTSSVSRHGSAGLTNKVGMRQAACSFTLLALFSFVLAGLTIAGKSLADTGILRPVALADAYADESAPSTNRGTLPNLLVGVSGEFRSRHRTYLAFDLSELPPDATISSATLKLYLGSDYPEGDVGFDIAAVSEPWTETGPDGIAWGDLETMDRQPASAAVGSVLLSSESSWKNIDVTSLVRSWADGSRANHGLMLALADEPRFRTEGPSLYRAFHSREAPECHPYLEIVYAATEAPPDTPPPYCDPLRDTTGPSIQEFSIEPDPAIAGEDVEIVIRAHDLEGMYRLQLLRGSEIVGDITTESSPTLTLSVTETLDPGRYHYTAIAWNRSMLTEAEGKGLRVEHDGDPPRVTVSHHPAEPAAGDNVTFLVRATDDSGIRHITLGVQGALHDQSVDSETEARVEFPYELRPDMRVIRYYAAATDQEGFYASTGTKYLLVDNAGEDADEDGLSDEIEDLMGLDSTHNDTDGDGLYDGWEVIGLDRNSDGIIDLDLPMLGANPHHKDVFVEIDWMEDEARGLSLKPPPTAVQALVNAFRNSGIRLHVDTGNLGGGNAVDYESNTCSYERDWLRDTKGANHDANRRGIFYYIGSMTAGEGCDSKYIGGGNIILRASAVHAYANKMMHELGHALGLGHGGQKQLTEPLSADTLGPNGDIITDSEIYWKDVDENYKPNYLSIMNYQYQWQLRICAIPDLDNPCTCIGHLDGTERLSVINPCDDVFPMTFNLATRPLNENALDETAGFAAPSDIGTYVWRRSDGGLELHRPTLTGWYYIERYPTSGCCTADCKPDPDDTVLSLADGSPIDWNFDGSVEHENVAYDLNRYWSRTRNTCQDALDNDLLSPSDIPLLQTKIWGNINFGFPEDDHSPVDPPEPVTPTDGEVADDIDNDRDGRIDEGFPDIDADQVADAVDNCESVSNPEQFDTGRKYRGDACMRRPDAPGNLSIAVIDRISVLRWDPGETKDILGFNVYRKIGDGSDFRRIGVSFPTTLGAASFADSECVDGAVYTITGVNLYMDEGPLSRGVIVADTDGDGICDRITARLRDPYDKRSAGDETDDSRRWMWLLLALAILFVLAITASLIARRST